jgi:hypothetical protein
LGGVVGATAVRRQNRPDRDVPYDQRVGHLLGVIATAVGAFVGTNIDDLVVLLLPILGMPKENLRNWKIYFGSTSDSPGCW